MKTKNLIIILIIGLIILGIIGIANAYDFQLGNLNLGSDDYINLGSDDLCMP